MGVPANVAGRRAFVSGHPVAIAQMSIQYCDALVDDTSARAQYFPGFDFSAQPATAFNATGRAIVLDSLVNHMMRANLEDDPDPAQVRSELDSLVTRLAACGTSCPAGRTPTIVKATCAALLGSAVTLIE